MKHTQQLFQRKVINLFFTPLSHQGLGFEWLWTLVTTKILDASDVATVIVTGRTLHSEPATEFDKFLSSSQINE